MQRRFLVFFWNLLQYALNHFPKKAIYKHFLRSDKLDIYKCPKKKVEGKSFQKVGWTEIFAGKFCGNKNQSNVKYIITKYALLYLYENTDNALGYQKFVGLERAEATAQQGEGVSI